MLDVIEKVSVQDQFLEPLKASHTLTSVFLNNGVQLKGYLQRYDQHVICLENNGRTQIVYKHSISTIMPSKPKSNNIASHS